MVVPLVMAGDGRGLDRVFLWDGDFVGLLRLLLLLLRFFVLFCCLLSLLLLMSLLMSLALLG